MYKSRSATQAYVVCGLRRLIALAHDATKAQLQIRCKSFRQNVCAQLVGGGSRGGLGSIAFGQRRLILYDAQGSTAACAETRQLAAAALPESCHGGWHDTVVFDLVATITLAASVSMVRDRWGHAIYMKHECPLAGSVFGQFLSWFLLYAG